MKLSDLVRSAQQRIAESGSSSPRLDAEVLLRHLMGLDRVEFFLRRDDEASEGVTVAYEGLVSRRVAREPIAYLTGEREFMGLSFHVSPSVLIPRPETELLVDWALGWIGERSGLEIVDIGTGSGAIAVSIAALDTSEANRITGSDVSDEALAMARHNADRLLTPYRRARIDFVAGSLLDWRDKPIDLLLANLPYLTPAQIASNPDLAAEPRLALEGGADGLDLVRQLVEQARELLAPGGAIGLELDPDQCETVEELLRQAFPEAPEIAIIDDLAGLRRHVVLTR